MNPVMGRLAPSLLLASALCLLCVPSAVAAREPASFALNPVNYDPALQVTRSYFVVAARPGQTVDDSVRVTNAGGAPGVAYLYPVDATTGRTSGAVYLDRAQPRRDVGAWVSLAKDRVDLDAGGSAVVPFTIHVPASAKPGDHLGGIVAENAAMTGASSGGSLQIRIRHLTVIAVEVQVPGAASTRVDVTGVASSVDGGYQYLYLHLTNTGELVSKPTGSVTVTDATGRTVVSRAFQLDTFLPGTAIDYPVPVAGKVLPDGGYRVVVRLTYGSAATGYRLKDGPTRTIVRTFDLTVRASNQAQPSDHQPSSPQPSSPQPANPQPSGPQSSAAVPRTTPAAPNATPSRGGAPAAPRATGKPRPATSRLDWLVGDRRRVVLAALGLAAFLVLLGIALVLRHRGRAPALAPAPLAGPQDPPLSARDDDVAAGRPVPDTAGRISRHDLLTGWERVAVGAAFAIGIAVAATEARRRPRRRGTDRR